MKWVCIIEIWYESRQAGIAGVFGCIAKQLAGGSGQLHQNRQNLSVVQPLQDPEGRIGQKEPGGIAQGRNHEIGHDLQGFRRLPEVKQTCR